MSKICQVLRRVRRHDDDMFDHITLNIRDFEKSLSFYTAALAPLGYEAQFVDPKGKGAGFGPKGNVLVWIAESDKRSKIHVAFKGPSRESVKKFHAAALKHGGKDNGAPGLRADYGPHYWAAFVLDPDGNNVEVVINEPVA